MTQAQAKAAIDAAFAARVGQMFGVFISNLAQQSEQRATSEFQNGFENSLKAHAIATNLIEKLVP